jgi:hypothetical protein
VAYKDSRMLAAAGRHGHVCFKYGVAIAVFELLGGHGSFLWNLPAPDYT